MALFSGFDVPTMAIDVAGGAAITSKYEYVSCTIDIDGKGSFADYSGQAGIRGRGKSTWLWYEKKPYRIKLDAGATLLGLEQDKDWESRLLCRPGSDFGNRSCRNRIDGSYGIRSEIWGAAVTTRLQQYISTGLALMPTPDFRKP